MLKLALAGVLSAVLIQTAPTHATPALKIEPSVPKVQTVRAAAIETAVSSASQPSPSVQPETIPTNGCNSYRSLVEQYDWNVQIMLAVMQAESSCNPFAVSPVNYDGIRDYGLLQLHGQYILDPAQNVAAAYRLWNVQGYHAWSSYNNGSFWKFM